MGLDGAYTKLDPLEPREAPPPQRPPGAALVAVLSALFLLTFLILGRPRLRGDADGSAGSCGDGCRIVLVESIPEGMAPGAGRAPNPSTFEAWLGLLGTAARSVDIASFYWTLTNEDTRTREPSAAQVGRADPGGAAAAAPARRGRARGRQCPLGQGAAGRSAGAGAQRCGRACRGPAAPHRRRPAHQVLARGRRPPLRRQRQHGLEVTDSGEGARSRRLQLQLLGPGFGQNLRGLLGSGRSRRVHPGAVAGQLLHRLQHGDAAGAGAQRHRGRRLLLELAAPALRRRPHAGPGRPPVRHRRRRGLRGRGGDELPAHHRVLAARALLAGHRRAAAQGRVRARRAAAAAGGLLAAQPRLHVPLPQVARRRRRQPHALRRGGAPVPGAHERGPGADPLRPRQPPQVHGDGEGGVRGDVQLVRGLLRAHGGVGAGGGPARGRRGDVPGAAPGRLRAGLELPVQRRHRRRRELGQPLRPPVAPGGPRGGRRFGGKTKRNGFFWMLALLWLRRFVITGPPNFLPWSPKFLAGPPNPSLLPQTPPWFPNPILGPPVPSLDPPTPFWTPPQLLPGPPAPPHSGFFWD